MVAKARPELMADAAGLVPAASMFPAEQQTGHSCFGSLLHDASDALANGYLDETGIHDPLLRDVIRNEIRSVGHLALRSFVVELNLARFGGLLQGESPVDRYRSFVLALRGRQYSRYFFEKYPVLGDLYRQLVMDCCKAVAELRQHVTREATRMRAQFGFDGLDLRSLELVGDRHGGTKRAARLTDSGGNTIFLKPRSAEPERFLGAVILLISTDLRHVPAVPETVPIGDYLAQRPVPPATSDQVDESAYLHGCWVALALAFNARDLHYENVIQSDAGPVVVDLECFFSPLPVSTAFDVLNAMLMSGLLPMRVMSIDRKRSVDWSAMGEAPAAPPNRMHYMVDDGTDVARLEFGHSPHEQVDKPSVLRSSLGRRGASELVDGFRDTLLALGNRAEELTALIERLDPVHRVRVVVKPTQHYTDVGRRAAHPRYLIDTAAHRYVIATELGRSGSAEHPKLLASEVDAVLDAGAPLLSIALDDSNVESLQGDHLLEWGLSPRASLRRAIEFVADPKFRSRAERLLVQVLVGRLGGIGLEDVIERSAAPRRPPMGVHSLLQAETDRLIRNAVETADGVGWLDLVESGLGDYEVEASGFDLYGGIAGTGIALAAAGDSCTDLEFRDELLSRVESSSLDWMVQTGRYGAFSGGGGAAFALAGSACLRQRRPPLESIEAIVEAAVEGCLDGEAWDLMSGSAGLLLLTGRLRESGHLAPEVAVRHASRLLDHLEGTSDPLSAIPEQIWWPHGKVRQEQLGGVAHGVAGIALALTPWRHLQKARHLMTGALEAQRSLAATNDLWIDRRDLPPASRIVSRLSWCHGAGGMMLLSEDHGSEWSKPEAIASFSIEPGFDSSLCHGLSGAILAGLRAPPDSVTRQSRALCERRVELLENDHYIDGLIDGLFLGRAGIIYTLSALERPSILSVNPLSLALPSAK